MDAEEAQDLYNQSFIDKPDILQKHQAAAAVVNGKFSSPLSLPSKVLAYFSDQVVSSKKIVFWLTLLYF